MEQEHLLRRANLLKSSGVKIKILQCAIVKASYKGRKNIDQFKLTCNRYQSPNFRGRNERSRRVSRFIC